MKHNTAVRLGIVKSNAGWKTKEKYSRKIQHAMRAAKIGDWRKCRFILEQMRPDSHPMVKWLLDGVWMA